MLKGTIFIQFDTAIATQKLQMKDEFYVLLSSRHSEVGGVFVTYNLWNASVMVLNSTDVKVKVLLILFMLPP